ncbi:putative 37S ribosomal protein [Podospora didyma]|uniref:37S ribosomal protein n=1 Tax=Podospora didyma TaxID=330526 RepID=A0AAE0P7F7_9PEZI|nr:putative 37S ribosomal protein [Podospora didyma]
MIRPRLRIPQVARGSLFAAAPVPRAAPLSMTSRRSLHKVAELPAFDHVGKVEGLYGELGYRYAWTEYQSHIIDRLNREIADKDYVNKPVKDIVLRTARNPEDAVIFNYASMAHNNEFFFRHLSAEPVEVPDKLAKQIKDSFGSMETLRLEMTMTANAMFGPGFVWLVKTNAASGNSAAFRVLTTYLAGSPYPGAHWRQQTTDMNTSVGAQSETGRDHGFSYLDNSAYAMGKKSLAATARNEYAPGGTSVIPVLCVNTWEHAWLPDYGVGGKEHFLNTWWEKVNWDLVDQEVNGSRRTVGGFGF